MYLQATKKAWLWTSLAIGGPTLSDKEYEQLFKTSLYSESLQVLVSNGTQTQQHGSLLSSSYG